MNILTPKQQGKIVYDELAQTEGLTVTIGNRNKDTDGPNERSHTVVTTSKKKISVEVIDIDNELVLSVKIPKGDLAEEEQILFKDSIIDYLGIEGGFSTHTPHAKNPRFRSDNHTQDLLEIKNLIENWKELEDGGASWRRSNPEKRILGVASHWYINYTLDDTTNWNRDSLDALTSRVSINESFEGDWDEHNHPHDNLYRLCIEAYKDGATVEEVAQHIKDNLTVAHITDSERRYLDFELGLQTKMPEGWKLGDDPLARLKLLKDFEGISSQTKLLLEGVE